MLTVLAFLAGCVCGFGLAVLLAWRYAKRLDDPLPEEPRVIEQKIYVYSDRKRTPRRRKKR